jgi:hypothetical protein
MVDIHDAATSAAASSRAASAADVSAYDSLQTTGRS